MKKTKKQAGGLNCLHCEGPLRVRSSRSLAPTCLQQTVQCVNPECGASYGVSIEIAHGIAPSACLDPDVQLRMATPRARVANDIHTATAARGPGVPPRMAANDDCATAEAVTVGG
ncbi:ogr/Delta-like zinc finger family protein [Novosphingopyxis sp. YJ-S2-01]|uniref:ogr/Delta-like zinc finger family protein n=1 Tax=Novosphingopyxis sp. YJ-S2-01 TaxID=2794021 RepID=UPI0018DC13D2|nr:ogr/Delta-like zinc finger family protein [Novosphingopyxis sp. YJ-S2-01]